MHYLSKEDRSLLEVTLCNLYRSADRSADLPAVRAGFASMTDAELERSLNEFYMPGTARQGAATP